MKYLKADNKLIRMYVISMLLLVFAVVTGIVLGSTRLYGGEIWDMIIKGNMENPSARILLYVRLPRVFAGLLCGSALSVSGVVLQNVLSNRLASPSVIGVNAGAGLAVTLVTAAGIQSSWVTSFCAFAGAFVPVMLISAGAKKWGASRGTVILMGVALNSLLGAFSDAVITFMPEVSIMRNDFRVGDFSSVSYSQLLPAVMVITIVIFTVVLLSQELEILTLGEETALSLGLDTGLMRTVFLLLSAALAGVAVSIAGLLSFVGLLVPHAVRRLAKGVPTKHIVILSAGFGAGFVTLCDTLSRVIFAPYEIPVGIIMAFLGAPFFIFILFRGKGDNSYA